MLGSGLSSTFGRICYFFLAFAYQQLLETIRLLVKPDHLPLDDIRAKGDLISVYLSMLCLIPPQTELFDLTARIQAEPLQDLAVALGDTVNATQVLVTKFIDGETQAHILKNEAFPQCQQAQNEVKYLCYSVLIGSADNRVVCRSTVGDQHATGKASR